MTNTTTNPTVKTVSTAIDAQRAASKTAVAEYVKGKTIREILKTPATEYQYTVDGQTIKATARVDVLRHVESAEVKNAVREKSQYIAQQVAFVQHELGKDVPKVHRKAMFTAMADVARLLGLDDVKFGNRDAAFMVAACTRGKRAAGAVTTDVSIPETAWRALSALITNKLNQYDAKLLLGQSEYTVQERPTKKPTTGKGKTTNKTAAPAAQATPAATTAA